MTVKELIDRLNELNSPDYEVELSNGMKLNVNNIRFAEAGTKVILGLSQKIYGLSELIENIKDCYYDIDDVLDKLLDITEELEELI